MNLLLISKVNNITIIHLQHINTCHIIIYKHINILLLYIYILLIHIINIITIHKYKHH